ncbi:unnamed protein product, partial [Mesorhabditis belari]|uniref:XPA C-terminal domain-containing protein n=1 Tax=Mesorhabditis belari TaxID=2138241 RepID=A0AAF3EWN7_9BILA
MAKRKNEMPLVEKLYMENLGTFEESGGFCNDDDQVAERREELAQKRQRRLDRASSIPADDCLMCAKPILDSFLWDRFRHPICDGCRDDKGAHKLISRTEVFTMYLLKDTDLDMRKPPLRYISRKNPHNPRYGDMKLYLTSQVVDRMLEVHGSHEGLEEAKREKDEKREVRNEKQFEKKVKEMRKQIRGAQKQHTATTRAHEHSFGEEIEDTKTGEWKRECCECGYVEKFEKM